MICAGPDGYRARKKFREMILGYKKKYDEQGSSIERLESTDLYQTLLTRLCSPSLFSEKKMVLCEGLLEKVTAKQASDLQDALVRDAEQTVVLDHEDKLPKSAVINKFKDENCKVYEFDTISQSELTALVRDLCNKYGVDLKMTGELINRYNSDLWAIDTALQALRVYKDADLEEVQISDLGNVFSLVDMVLAGKSGWREKVEYYDSNQFLNTLINQMRQWLMVQDGCAEGIHPFVQKKLKYLKLENGEEKLKQLIGVLVASRSSLAQGEEMVQLF